MTDKLRAAMELALEQVQEFKRRWWLVPAFGNKVNKATREAVTNAHSPIFALEHALRTALAEQPAEQSAKHGEPVRTEFTRVINHAIEQGTEAWVFLRCWQEGDWSGCAEFGFEPNMAAYTAPQPAKQPLTDEEITTVAFTQHNYPRGTVGSAMFRKGVRFAERTHGINVPQARREQE